MPNNRTYMRKFIILESRKTEYSKDKKPKGHVKIEVRDGRGKISFNLEGLKPLTDDKKIYKGYLVSKDLDTSLMADFGGIRIKENGKGSLECGFNPESVAKTGHPIDDFNAVIVKVSSIDGRGNNVVPLGGYIEKSNDSLEVLIKSLESTNKDKKASIEKKRDVEVENKKEDEYKQKEVEESSRVKESLEVIEDNEDEYIVEDVEKTDIYEEYEEDREDEDYDEEVEVEEILEDEIEIENTTNDDIKKDDDYNIDDIAKMDTDNSDIERYKAQEEDEDIEDYKELEKGEIEDLDPYEYEELSEEDDEDIEEVKNEDYEGSSKEDEFLDIKGREDDYFVNEEDINEEEYREESRGEPRQEVRDPQRVNRYPRRGPYNPVNRAKKYSHQIYSYATNILKFFEEVSPFNKEFKGYTWWEIEYDKKNLYRGFLPFYNYIISMYYPNPLMYKTTTCQSLIRKYRNYLFGISKEGDDVKYYIYGIPGKFTREEQPYRGATGFTTWLPKKDDDDLGYWIIHIDAVTGKIVKPFKSTRPR